jgi:hypothetical protein
MRSASPDLEFIDAELRLSAVLLDGVRRKHRVQPSADNARALERARDEIDRLLDHRLAARR